MAKRGLSSIGIRKILPTQIDFTKVVSGSAAGPGSFIALSSDGKAVLVNAKNLIDDSSIIDHSSVSIVAGTGLSGGGTITTSRTLSLNLSDVIANDGANRILTSDGDGTLTAESTITYDGANERLGLGTTSPSVKLDIVGESSGETQVRMAQHNTDSDAPDIRLYKSRGTEASPSAVANDDNLARVNSFAYNGSSYVQAGTFGWNADGTDGDSYFTLSTRVGGVTANRLTVNAAGNVDFLDGDITVSSGKIHRNSGPLTLSSDSNVIIDLDDNSDGSDSFQVRDGGNTAVLYVGEDGNAGIGTTTPLSRLHVYKDLDAPDDLGDFDNYQLVVRGGTSTGKAAGILLSTSANGYGGSAIVHYDNGTGGLGDLVFYTKQSTAIEPPTEAMRLHDDGSVTKPSNPCFMVKRGSTQSNLAVATNVKIQFDSERFDQGSNFDSSTNYRFTAPVTGKYLLSTQLFFTYVDEDHTGYIKVEIVTSNHTYLVDIFEPEHADHDHDAHSGGTVVADMDANDTAYVNVYISAGGAVNDVEQRSYFSGCLLS